ncbi:hypothetical protein C8R46DRAFT_1184871 [Mycena filopes]|nr:hypothetical protein C8R46DRAFT_1184871 [Mycena filopes]
MPSVIWIDSDGEDDEIEFVEAPTNQKRRNASAGPSSAAKTSKRQRPQSPDSDIHIIEGPAGGANIAPLPPLAVQSEADREFALALQKQWDAEPEPAAAPAPKKRRRVAKKKKEPEAGIVFKTIDGEEDADNAARLELVKRDFEQALGDGLKIKTVQWVVNATLETRFEAAKETLDSHGIDSTEQNLFHGTAATNIQSILENGFMIPGVTPGARRLRAHGASCGVGVYLATSPLTSVGYTQGASRMFMCRVSQAKPRPLGENGYESWTGGDGGGVYVVKYVDLIVPRYVVEFEQNAAWGAFQVGAGGIGLPGAFMPPPGMLAGLMAGFGGGGAVPGAGAFPPMLGLGGLGGLPAFGAPPAPFAGLPPGLFGAAPAPAPAWPYGLAGLGGLFAAPPAAPLPAALPAVVAKREPGVVAVNAVVKVEAVAETSVKQEKLE